MKITNFKMYPLMIAVSVFFALSGCDSTTGISSDSGIAAPTTVPATVPDATTSTITASPASVAADGTETATITVTVTDTSSNLITDATVTLDQGAGSSSISDVTNVGDGTYTFEVNSTKAETVTYIATADGVTITQTAEVIFEVGAADAGTSTVTASPEFVAADGTATSTVTVTVYDVNSNPITDATVIPDQGAGSSTIGAVTNVGDGTYTFDVTSTTAETVTYTATADGVTITDAANVTFKKGVADAGTSTVTASPEIVAADGIETATITVTVNDANSNPIIDATVTLDQGVGSSTIGAVTNVGDGTYTFDVKSTTADTVTYTATADAVTITDTVNVTFTQTVAEAQCLSAVDGGYDIITINGRNWLDRNLGASQFAANTNDTAAYGDYYQWGRGADGHENNESSMTSNTLDPSDTSVRATVIEPNQGNTWDGVFILSNADWTQSSVDSDGSERASLWRSPTSDTNLNQVCPCGYVVPSVLDFESLNMSAQPTIAELNEFKVAYAGWRRYDDGSITQNDVAAFFWTSDINTSYRLNEFHNAPLTFHVEATGVPIRCIKPLP